MGWLPTSNPRVPLGSTATVTLFTSLCSICLLTSFHPSFRNLSKNTAIVLQFVNKAHVLLCAHLGWRLCGPLFVFGCSIIFLTVVGNLAQQHWVLMLLEIRPAFLQSSELLSKLKHFFNSGIHCVDILGEHIHLLCQSRCNTVTCDVTVEHIPPVLMS